MKKSKSPISIKELWDSPIFEKIYRRGAVISLMLFCILSYMELNFIMSRNTCLDYVQFINYHDATKITLESGEIITIGVKQHMNISPDEASAIMINYSEMMKNGSKA
jgi:hypothetical protein